MGVTHKRRCALLLAAAAVAHALSPQTDEDEMDAGGLDAPGGKCKYTSPDGYNFDLNGMKRTDHDYLGTTPGGYSYRFNVCAGTVKVCNRQSAPASKWRGSKCNNLGDSQTQEFSLINPADAMKGVKVTYRDGDICKKQVNGQMEIGSREVTYQIQCDPSQDVGLLKHISEVSMCEYSIIFLSKHGCPVGTVGGGHGWFTVFLILFGAALYLSIGIGLNRYKYGMQGVESIPHLEYWQQLPGLVRDGAVFSYGKARDFYDYAHMRVSTYSSVGNGGMAPVA